MDIFLMPMGCFSGIYAWNSILASETTEENVAAIDNSNSNSGTLVVHAGDLLNRSGEYQSIEQQLKISLIVPRNDTTNSASAQAITAQTQLASQFSTQTIHTASNRLHFLRAGRERHAQNHAESRNRLDIQNRFTQGLKVHFSNPDIDHLVRRAVIANQMNTGPADNA